MNIGEFFKNIKDGANNAAGSIKQSANVIGSSVSNIGEIAKTYNPQERDSSLDYDNYDSSALQAPKADYPAKPFAEDQRIQFYKQEGDLTNPALVGNPTLVMLASFYACRYPYSDTVANGDISSAEKYLDEAFADCLGSRFKYKLDSALFRFVPEINRWIEPIFEQRRARTKYIDKVKYDESAANILYFLSREGGLALNYMNTISNDLKRFGRDLEFSFRRDSEYWTDYDPLFYLCYYRSIGAFNTGAYNFNLNEKRGEYQAVHTYQTLRYQNYIENLRPSNHKITKDNINAKRPDCMPAYLAPSEVLNFESFHDAASEQIKKASHDIAVAFENNPLLFFDSNKARIIITDYEEDVNGAPNLLNTHSMVHNFGDALDVNKLDIGPLE